MGFAQVLQAQTAKPGWFRHRGSISISHKSHEFSRPLLFGLTFGKIIFFNRLRCNHLCSQPQEFSLKIGGLRTYGRETIINDYDFPSSDMSPKALPN